MLLQLFTLAVGCTAVFAQTYTHNDVMAAVDATFRRRDLDGDSILELNELLAAYDAIDADKDGRVSESEYEQRGPYHSFFGIIFQQLDNDGNGYLDRSAEYGQYLIMDTDYDGEVSRREYDTYYTKIVEDAIKNYGYLLGPFPFTSSRPGGFPSGSPPAST